VKLGLADAIGDLRTVLRARYGDKVQTPVIAPPTGCFPGLQAASPARARHCLAFRFSEDLISALEERAIWARYGL
jgi:serine protease SohB